MDLSVWWRYNMPPYSLQNTFLFSFNSCSADCYRYDWVKVLTPHQRADPGSLRKNGLQTSGLNWMTWYRSAILDPGRWQRWDMVHGSIAPPPTFCKGTTWDCHSNSCIHFWNVAVHRNVFTPRREGEPLFEIRDANIEIRDRKLEIPPASCTR
jgi:hypothetical protein